MELLHEKNVCNHTLEHEQEAHKLLVSSASLLVTRALPLVTRSY